MTKDTPRVELPADATDIKLLHVELCPSRIVRQSVEAMIRLADAGFALPDGTLLCSRRAYLEALSEFCVRTGLTPEAIADANSTHRQRDHLQEELIDAPRARRLREMKEGS